MLKNLQNFSGLENILQFVLFLIVVTFFPTNVLAQSYWMDSKNWDVEQPPFTKGQNKNWSFDSGVHLRTSYNFLNNTVDLNRRNRDDKVNYFGLAYDFTFSLHHFSGVQYYMFVERRGRADYDAPISGNRQINSLFGIYRWYRHEDLLPRVRELFAKIPLNPAQDAQVKLGLFPYAREVGHGVALGGKYENYGVTTSAQSELFDWNLHWEKADLNNRIRLAKVVDFDKVNRFNDTSANFYAGDTTLKLGPHAWQFYLGWLNDRTPHGARASQFNTQIKHENLITPGTYLKLNSGRWNFGFEGARNFGKAEGVNGNRDVKHMGYLLISDAAYDLGSFKPKAKIIVASGNKFNEKNYNELTLNSDKNKAFSIFSPLNTNLTDTHYQKQFGPYVAMAGGYSVNFGVARPGTFGDPFLFENLVASTLGFDYTPFDKVYVGMDYWYLRAKEAGYGLNRTGQVVRFPKELGHEIDLFISYNITKNIKISLLSGYFLPGDYYKQSRSDTAANNIFAPTPRRDGKADPAYQAEFGFDINF